MKRLLLSPVLAKWCELIGLWMIIGGLIADGVLFIDAIFWEAIPPKPEKWLSLAFTLTIALGVWIEHIGAKMLEAPRRLTLQQRSVVAEKMRSFAKIADNAKQEAAVFPTSFTSVESGNLADDIASALEEAEWRVTRYPVTYSPVGTTFAIEGVALLIPKNNVRALRIAHALVSALRSAGIDTEIADFRRNGCEELSTRPSQGYIDSNPSCSAISVMVGERP
jgi:hypothetical protein